MSLSKESWRGWGVGGGALSTGAASSHPQPLPAAPWHQSSSSRAPQKPSLDDPSSHLVGDEIPSTPLNVSFFNARSRRPPAGNTRWCPEAGQGRAALPPAPLRPFALGAAQVPLVLGADQAPPRAGGADAQGTGLHRVRVLESAKDLLSKNLHTLLSLYPAFHLKCFTPFKGLNPPAGLGFT